MRSSVFICLLCFFVMSAMSLSIVRPPKCKLRKKDIKNKVCQNENAILALRKDLKSLQESSDESSSYLVSCPSDFEQKGYHCFSYTKSALSWFNAKTFCESYGADLVVIDSAEKQAILNAFVTGKGSKFWVNAATLVEGGKWRWLEKQTIGGRLVSGYTNWIPGQPDNWKGAEKCMVLLNGKWNDVSCNIAYLSVCETRPLKPKFPLLRSGK